MPRQVTLARRDAVGPMLRTAAGDGDVKKRQSWPGSPTAFGGIVLHSDGAGVIEAVGSGAGPARAAGGYGCTGPSPVGPFGTAAGHRA